jgi:hypothetical protein
MKWLKRKLQNWLYDVGDQSGIRKVTNVLNSDYVEVDPIISFRIYSAQNGKIIEFSKYDRVKDRTDRTLYIIGKDEDIAEKVGKCLSLELLR